MNKNNGIKNETILKSEVGTDNVDKYEGIYMNTPVGKFPVREHIVKESNKLSDDELIKMFYNDNKKTGFVNPELLALIRDRGIYNKYLKYKARKDNK